ncbi:MAG: ORF6N domain-containing protein [Verrucomicrobia bacterium]|nr:ORF6N domain-containing protein [Verrucomicrobiota bacterium]
MNASHLPVRRRPTLELRAKSERAANIEDQIRVLRGHPVLLDVDLAHICGVPVARLLEQMRRQEPLPGEFCFPPERFELVAAAADEVGGHSPQYVFTEHGALMAAMLLETPRTFTRGVQIVRAFARLRQRREKHDEFAPGSPDAEPGWERTIPSVLS